MSLLLGRALALSVMLHAFALAYLGTRMPQPPLARTAVADLSVLLREERLPEPPPLRTEPQDAKPPTPAPRVVVRKSKPQPAKKTPAKKEPAPFRPLYPLEAIARGLEGDVMVRVRLDDRGNVIASHLEASSGHALLDEAAVQAARTLRGLPDGMPRESLLPVRFRLR
jgi:protein TonB